MHASTAAGMPSCVRQRDAFEGIISDVMMSSRDITMSSKSNSFLISPAHFASVCLVTGLGVANTTMLTPFTYFLILVASLRIFASVALTEQARTFPEGSALIEALATASAPKSFLRSLATNSGHFCFGTRATFALPERPRGPGISSRQIRSSRALSMSDLRTTIHLLALTCSQIALNRLVVRRRRTDDPRDHFKRKTVR